MSEEAERLKRERKELLVQARNILDAAERQKRELTDVEEAKVDRLLKQSDQLEASIQEAERDGSRGRAATGLQARMGVYASRGPLTGRPTPEGRYSDMDDLKDFSIVRAVRAVVNNDWRGAEREREASDEVAKQLGRESRGGFLIPERAWLPSRQEQRDLLVGTASAGGYLKATDLLGGSFIDRLVNASVMLSAGVIPINDLVGDVAIPRLATGPTAYWVAESGVPTESAETFEQVALSPKSVAAFVDISRKLILQSSVDIENLVREDIVKSLATAIDLAILQGTGASNQPLGVVGITGVTDVSGTNGEAISWAELLQLESTIATANAALGRLAYITNSTIRSSLKSTTKVSADAGAGFLWDKEPNPVNSYPCHITNQIPANLTKGSGSSLSYVFFGNWADVILGRWSGIDVLVDPYTGGTAGTVRIIAFADVDVAVRHPASFAYGFYS